MFYFNHVPKTFKVKKFQFFSLGVPEYQDEPTIVLIGQDFLNVSWPKWDGVNGTPPVVVYRLYSKLSSSNEWNSTIDITANDTQEEYAKAIDKLVPDTEYDIRIAAVREGQNGEGPPGPVLDKVKTHCRGMPEIVYRHTLTVLSKWIVITR